jgi:hypothetical protein
MLGATCKAAVEGFLDVGNADKRRETYANFVAALLAFLIALVIMSFVGKLLWNNVIVDLFSFARPARSIWQVLGLMLFVSLLLGK